MSFNVEYLKRNLRRRVERAYPAFVRSIEAMMAEHAGKGMLASGATVSRFEEISTEALRSWYGDAAVFTYSLTDQHGPEVSEHLNDEARNLIASICIFVRERGMNTGLTPEVFNKQADHFHSLLNRISAEQLDDFEHGILGNTRMKKDPLITMTANQTNSPGSVQQLGVGSTQTVNVGYQSLVSAIDSIVGSEEYNSLAPGARAEFHAIADFIKAEAGKTPPDEGRLKRLGSKLLAFTEELAMKAASSTLAAVLTKLFVG